MRRGGSVLVLGAALLALGFVPATGQDSGFLAACMKASGGNSELCACKATQAEKLLDAEMMGFVVLSMAEPARFTAMEARGEVPETVRRKWGPYVAQSNRACIPGY